MELLILIILYYLSQNPDFERSVKPLLGELKNSEQALKFLEELSQFSKLFSAFNGQKEGGMSEPKGEKKEQPEPPKAEKPQGEPSPTAGIADGFIEDLLERYFKRTPK
ncbi:MAG: hypothetical protein IJY34_01240 [Clostridia bacterium]|nr:hypothetical protein [Clostridia bacterium]